jgi:4'-phosphopantetheinyl transferase
MANRVWQMIRGSWFRNFTSHLPLQLNFWMPLFRKTEFENCSIGVWKIGEELSFFEALFRGHPDIAHEKKRLQWFASRHLANEMLGVPDTIINDQTGKPNFKTSPQNISLSHTVGFAAVIISKQCAVGIDIEAVHRKVERIAHKFLTEEEIADIPDGEKAAKMMLYWSAKESLYKLYGWGALEFKTQLLIEPFALKQSGELKADILTPHLPLKNLTVHYEFFDGHVLSWVASA